MYEARVIADSVGPTGHRATSVLCTYPRIVHAEYLRHREFSYSVASTRAIPGAKQRDKVRENPMEPAWWGKAQSGMQARQELTGEALKRAREIWERGRQEALQLAEELEGVGLHKQLANRPIETWADVVQLTSATSWTNFLALRDHADAQPEIAKIARHVYGATQMSSPLVLPAGEWHLPFLTAEDYATAVPPARVGVLNIHLAANLQDSGMDLRGVFLVALSAARCARTSYMNHEGRRVPEEDVDLYLRLVNSTPGHWSPTEHVCRAMTPLTWRDRWALKAAEWISGRKKFAQHGERFLLGSGNFCGFEQLRKLYSKEYVGGMRL